MTQFRHESSDQDVDNPMTAALTAALTEPHGTIITSEVVELIQRRLSGHLRRKFNEGLTSDEIHDLVIDVIMRLSQRVKDKGLPNQDGYLYRAADNAAFDKLRRQGTSVEAAQLPDEGSLGGDDDVAAAFDKMSSAADVVTALRVAGHRGDRVAYQVVTTALTETERQGKRPSNRWIAEQMNISHTAVNKALARFKNYLDLAQEPQ